MLSSIERTNVAKNALRSTLLIAPRMSVFSPRTVPLNGIFAATCFLGWFSNTSAATWGVPLHRARSGCFASERPRNWTFLAIGFA